MTSDDIKNDNLVEACSFDPVSLKDKPVGMFHCPECGEMVIGGSPHPEYWNLQKFLDEDKSLGG